VGHVARMRERNAFILIGESEGTKSLGRRRRIWDDNIQMNLKEIACECNLD